MANNKKASTSKTARVMNLLSKNREETPEVENIAEQEQDPPLVAPAAEVAASEPVPAPAPASPPHPSTPPLISSMQADSVISGQVLSALESALEDELGAAAESAAEAAPAAPEEPAAAKAVDEVPSQPEIAPAPAPVEDTPISAEPVSTKPVEAAPIVQESAAEEIDDQPHPPTRFPVDSTTIYVNVMETLVEDKAMKYINLFGLCKCHRCIADIKALTLNRLEPKYVVMHKGEVIPRISLYESQFSAAVTSNLLTACKLVMEHPRHDRV